MNPDRLHAADGLRLHASRHTVVAARTGRHPA